MTGKQTEESTEICETLSSSMEQDTNVERSDGDPSIPSSSSGVPPSGGGPSSSGVGVIDLKNSRGRQSSCQSKRIRRRSRRRSKRISRRSRRRSKSDGCRSQYRSKSGRSRSRHRSKSRRSRSRRRSKGGSCQSRHGSKRSRTRSRRRSRGSSSQSRRRSKSGSRRKRRQKRRSSGSGCKVNMHSSSNDTTRNETDDDANTVNEVYLVMETGDVMSRRRRKRNKSASRGQFDRMSGSGQRSDHNDAEMTNDNENASLNDSETKVIMAKRRRRRKTAESSSKNRRRRNKRQDNANESKSDAKAGTSSKSTGSRTNWSRIHVVIYPVWNPGRHISCKIEMFIFLIHKKNIFYLSYFMFWNYLYLCVFTQSIASMWTIVLSEFRGLEKVFNIFSNFAHCICVSHIYTSQGNFCIIDWIVYLEGCWQLARFYINRRYVHIFFFLCRKRV